MVSIIRYGEIENVEITKASPDAKKSIENLTGVPDEIIDADKQIKETAEVPLDGVLRQLIIGPHQYVIKIFPKNKALKVN